MKLLIVDDSTILRKTIIKLLENNKIQDLEIVGEAANGVEALELFKEKKPDLVTMDITMPEMDGIQCIKEILKLDSSIKILVVTSLFKSDVEEKVMSLGASGFVRKPIEDDTFMAEFQKLF